jgi:hypothetical protein
MRPLFTVITTNRSLEGSGRDWARTRPLLGGVGAGPAKLGVEACENLRAPGYVAGVECGR